MGPKTGQPMTFDPHGCLSEVEIIRIGQLSDAPVMKEGELDGKAID